MIEYRGKRDVLVQSLREAIFRGELKVGQRLRQDDLAAQYNVSSTPVREALRVLEAQGLVSYEPHRGVAVSDVVGTFDQAYRLREALECLAIEMAVENITDERISALFELAATIEQAEARGDEAGRHDAHADFHRVLYAGCNFPLLIETIQLVWIRFPWDELLSLPGLKTATDHREIAETVAKRSPRAAAERFRRHLDFVRETLATTLRERGGVQDRPEEPVVSLGTP